jgi:hypothetical protein
MSDFKTADFENSGWKEKHVMPVEKQLLFFESASITGP